ncbi:MAG: methyltransferase domain-containing protein [Balneolaceae bacterium]|nr:methyltransferase domain-containing protein [Balneolaceae bacterium]
MPFFLKKRNEQLIEKMDRPDCDTHLLFNTYKQFTTINRLISGWQNVYKKHIRPVLTDPSKIYSILDIGCGGGDIIKLLDELTKMDGYQVRLTGIDPDSRAIQFLSNRDWPENVTFLQASSSDLIEKNRSFDIVISNHLVHHLTNSELTEVCTDAEKLASKKIIFNDIERSDIGYGSFRVFASLIFHNSFIVEDGLTSIKRSFRKQELKEALPDNWQVHRQFPFRLLATLDVKTS